MGKDPKDTSFFKAILLSVGILLVLDKDATPFSRIWCCYEEGIIVSDMNKGHGAAQDFRVYWSVVFSPHFPSLCLHNWGMALWAISWRENLRKPYIHKLDSHFRIRSGSRDRPIRDVVHMAIVWPCTRYCLTRRNVQECTAWKCAPNTV